MFFHIMLIYFRITILVQMKANIKYLVINLLIMAGPKPGNIVINTYDINISEMNSDKIDF